MTHTRHAIRCTAVLAGVVLACLAASGASAQSAGRSMDIDGSAISTGMGGASAAVSWSAEPNYWANPALLGYYHGVRYQYARSELVPGLATDITLTSKRVTLGAFGVGLELSGRPFEGMGGTKLDYGLSEAVDQSGSVVGIFDSFEEYKTVGVGVSLAELLRSIAPGTRAAGWARTFDLAAGFARKSVDIQLTPSFVAGPASATTEDVGLLARGAFDLGATPGGAGAPARLDLSLALAVLNFNDARFTFVNEDQSFPATRMRRLGGAARLSFALPEAWSRAAGSPFGAALVRGFDPLASIGVAYDDEHVQAGSSSAGGYSVQHVGLEAALLNLLFVRAGYVEDVRGEVRGGTWGLGIGLPIAGVAGARYDYGSTPQPTDLPDVKRQTASVYVDPIALWRLRGATR